MKRDLLDLVKKPIKEFFSMLGVGITSKTTLSRLESFERSRSDATLRLLSKFEPEVALTLLSNLNKANSQLQQDLFVLGVLRCKQEGFYVEFGATDGIAISNTYLLETEFGWKGILVEPCKVWHRELFENRRGSIIETKCVWRNSSQKLEFCETNELELSTINSFKSSDNHGYQRAKGKVYEVETISLLDLLQKHNAPEYIDFLSIDTEGSEFEILKAFDFDKYKFAVIACEHNFTANRERIFELLESNGYIRVFEDLSLFDDWYIDASLAKGLKL